MKTKKEIEKGCGKEFRNTWQFTVPKANLFICGEGILCSDCNDQINALKLTQK